jgi:hypothetical protein
LKLSKETNFTQFRKAEKSFTEAILFYHVLNCNVELPSEELLELHCDICGISAKSSTQVLYSKGWLWANVYGESMTRCPAHWKDSEIRGREMLREAGIRH